MGDMERAKEIADNLSAAQVKAMLWLPADGLHREHGKGDPRAVSFWALSTVIRGDPSREIATIYRLCVKGQGKRKPGSVWPSDTWAATPLGLAVRRILEDQNNG